MLSQQLIGDYSDLSGTLTITAGPAGLAELEGLKSELALRMNITTQPSGYRGTEPAPEPPPNGGEEEG